MQLRNMHLAMVNKDLGGRTLAEARRMVMNEEACWVYAKHSTLKLVSYGYELQDGEQFLKETCEGGFIPYKVYLEWLESAL